MNVAELGIGIIVAGLAMFGMCTGFAAPASANDEAPNEIHMSESMADATTQAIRSFGYNCPLAKMAFAMGDDTRGTVTRVFCGPADRAGVYSGAVYRVTFIGSDRIDVQPWRD